MWRRFIFAKGPSARVAGGAVVGRGTGTGPLRETVSDAFMSGLHAGCLTASAVCLVGALFVLAFLPAHLKKADPL